MKGNTKPTLRFVAVLLALLSVGMHAGVIAIPVFAGHKFGMMFIAFLLLFASILF